MENEYSERNFILNLFKKYLDREPLQNELLFHENELINLSKTFEEKEKEFNDCNERLDLITNIIIKKHNININSLSFFDLCFIKYIIKKYNFDYEYIFNYFKNYRLQNKIALLLSGHSRNFNLFIDSTKKFFLDEINPDIFIHTWDNVGFQSIDNHKHGSSWITKKDKNIYKADVIRLLKPKDMIIENFKQKLDSFNLDDSDDIFYFNGQAKDGASKYIDSQLYSIYKTNLLKSSFEKNKNFIYDIVIRMRFDFKLNKKIDINNLCELLFNIRENNKIFYIAHPINTKHGHPGGGGGCKSCIEMYKNNTFFEHKHSNDICDIILISSSKNMNFYSSLYLFSKKIYKENSRLNIENLKKYNLIYTKIKNTYYIHEFGDAIEKYTFCYYPEKLIRKHLENYILLNDDVFHGEIERCRL